MGDQGKSQHTKESQKVKRCIECSGKMKLATIQVGDLPAEGYRCQECGHEVLTLGQMKEHERRRDLVRAFARSRKVVKVGNSVGLTLPKEFFFVGQELDIQVIDGHSLRIDLVESGRRRRPSPRRAECRAA
jgi:DNA-directed RNA polymerase subunit RPC12/RpoP